MVEAGGAVIVVMVRPASDTGQDCRVIEMAAGGSFRAEIHVGQGPGRGWSAGWPFGRLVISDGEITIGSSLIRWIPERSAGTDTAGEISVSDRLLISLPVFGWRRQAVLGFEDPASPLAGVSLMLPGRTGAIDELRASGFAVTDRRAGS